MTFDKKMNWKKHLELLKSKTQNNLKLIKTIAAKNWGADSQILINTYKTTILSKLDYGVILYDSSKYTQLIDPIQNSAIKIALGAFHTSPTFSLITEANILPLNYRRKILISKPACKLASAPENPITKNIFIEENHSAYNETQEPKRTPFDFIKL